MNLNNDWLQKSKEINKLSDWWNMETTVLTSKPAYGKIKSLPGLKRRPFTTWNVLCVEVSRFTVKTERDFIFWKMLLSFDADCQLLRIMCSAFVESVFAWFAVLVRQQKHKEKHTEDDYNFCQQTTRHQFDRPCGFCRYRSRSWIKQRRYLSLKKKGQPIFCTIRDLSLPFTPTF